MFMRQNEVLQATVLSTLSYYYFLDADYALATTSVKVTEDSNSGPFLSLKMRKDKSAYKVYWFLVLFMV